MDKAKNSRLARLVIPAVLMLTAGLAHMWLDTAFLHRLAERREQKRHDRPGEADRFFYEQRAYPSGVIPANWRDKAARHIAGMRPASLAKTAESWSWVSLGPTNIAGRIRALAMEPGNASVLYAGSAGGGIWKTTDGGVSWRALDDFLPNLRIGSLAVHPTEPNTVLAGNGEGFVIWQNALAYGRGIYASTDGGNTWSLLPATANANFEFVFDIAYDPFDPGIILAATRVGIMRSGDGGATWTRMRVTFSSIRGMVSVFSRTTEGLVYACIEGSGIFRSSDHGLTWEGPKNNGIQFSGGFTRVQLAAAPSNGDILYAAFTARDENCAGIFRSSDRGDTWTEISIPKSEIDGLDYMREQGQYNSVLAVHPTNPNQVWAGGIDLYRTSNGGTSWKQMTNWFSVAGYPYVHADQHALLYNPKTPMQLFAACDGGVFRTNNSGTTWIDANAGLVTTQFHTGTPHPTSDVVLGGTIDNGNLRVSSGSKWLDVTGGDGGSTAIDYNDPRTMYAELYYLDFYKSTLSGAAGTFVSKMNGIPTDPGGGTTDRCAFMPPFEMDPTNPKILYAGTYRVYRTTNAAEVWTPVSPDLSAGGFLTAIGISKSNGEVVYTGSSTGAVYVTKNSGGDWTRVSTGLPSRYITDIAVHPANPAIAYLTLSGFGSGHVFRTADYGATWTNASGTDQGALPDVPANTIVFHPGNFDRLYIGTDAGVFTTQDGGGIWLVLTQQMGNVTVADLQVRKDGTIFAATHGRGVFKSSFSLLDTQKLPDAMTFTVGDMYPNPVSSGNSSVTVGLRMPAESNIVLELFDPTGSKIYELERSYRVPGTYTETIPLGKSGNGVYFCRVSSPSADGVYLRKFVVYR